RGTKEVGVLEGRVVTVKGQQVRLWRLGRDGKLMDNQSTGAVQCSHVTTYKRVDSEQFVKLFTANIGLTFELSSAGIKAFGVLVWSVQNSALSKDEVDLDTLVLEAFLQCQVSASKQPLRLSLATFKRGLNELEKAKIIAKTMRQGRYFINPNFVFNGDRIAFSPVISRKNAIGKQEDKSG
ncbi:hypothetical protein, partial [Klebsiella pneumoniae]|uniref:hypothetical protein n=1 Tax=Klebsiella pneumoniae TaxID=573 RepID=UPI0038576FE2